jgi:hypothetical protein
MPYRTEQIRFDTPFFDKRVKLIPCQKLKVQWLYETGEWSIRGLAKAFRVNKTLIRMIVQPEYAERMKKAAKLRRSDGRYYDKETHTEAMRVHRKDKDVLLKSLMPFLSISKQRLKEFDYPSREAYEAAQTCVAIKITGHKVEFLGTYSRRTGGTDAIRKGVIPKEATLTTWAKLRRYKEMHPKAEFNFDLP